MRYLILTVLLFSLGCFAAQVSSNREREPSSAPADAAPLPKPCSPPTLVGQIAPDFRAKAIMPDNSFKDLSLSSYRGKYVILFMYPMDFTFVCPTEIIMFDKMLDEFTKRNCAVIGASTDSEYTHLAWKKTPVDKGGIGQIRYPLVSDITKRIARSYGVLHEESVALRGLFLIDPKGKVRHALVNDLSLGRNVDEALRTLQALQIVDTYGHLCPANWHPGDEVIRQRP